MMTPLEQAALRNFRTQQIATEPLDRPEHWLTFGLESLLATCQQVRNLRSAPLANHVVFKDDGSPSIPLEHSIEEQLRQRLQQQAPNATLMGEESGGALSRRGVSIAIDPVDGTWALINRSNSHATSLAFFDQGALFLGMVANAATGEISYALNGQPTRLLQLSCYGEPDRAFDLPFDRTPGPHAGTGRRPLVNLHPARSAGEFAAKLHEGWQQRRIGMLKSVGGSPAWALLEAAKGSFVYVNHWSGRSPEPFDLAAAVMLLRSAGGEISGLDGNAIDEFHHQGPFVAGLDAQERSIVIDLLCQD